MFLQGGSKSERLAAYQTVVPPRACMTHKVLIEGAPVSVLDFALGTLIWLFTGMGQGVPLKCVYPLKGLLAGGTLIWPLARVSREMDLECT